MPNWVKISLGAVVGTQQHGASATYVGIRFIDLEKFLLAGASYSVVDSGVHDAGSDRPPNSHGPDHTGPKTGFALASDAKMAINGVNPVVRPTLPAAATDGATKQSLANSGRTAIIPLGPAQ